ncbi:MAG TPA: pseudouridine synthase [Thiolinea sp.]|nr:pseudouridine synthase [Thiolinea sp.]
MRLDQFVSQALKISRNEAQKFIRAGLISLNGQVVLKSPTAVPADAQVRCEDEILSLPGLIYLMLNKPLGVISATEDPSQRTVLDLIKHPHVQLLHPVGRLDKDTTGLLLLTNDGQWSHRITAPRKHVAKVYLASLAEPLTMAAAEQLQQGVLLHGEAEPVKASKLELLPDCQVRITIHEGKYHQVKRMLAAVGNHVDVLHREQIGKLCLDPQLLSGAWRALSSLEQELVLVAT